MNKQILIEDINNKWNPERFYIPRQPLHIDYISPIVLESKKDNILDMPIKLPKEDFQIPFDIEVEQIVDRCIQFEEEINVQWEDYYCYLTMNQGYVGVGETQRNSGAHFDGMQGEKYKEKFNVCHQYLVSSSLPTIYYTHEFNAERLDVTKHNWFNEFDRQKDKKYSMTPEPYELVLQTAYNVHECSVAKIGTKRTFVRIELSLKKFNRLGNTLNPLIDTSDWDYEPQPIPCKLI